MEFNFKKYKKKTLKRKIMAYKGKIRKKLPKNKKLQKNAK